METLLGTGIPKTVQGLVYLCEYNYHTENITINRELFYTTQRGALEAYANIPNPESQIAKGSTHGKFLISLRKLHKNMQDPKWLKLLGELI